VLPDSSPTGSKIVVTARHGNFTWESDIAGH
jgi:hypothetical protein